MAKLHILGRLTSSSIMAKLHILGRLRQIHTIISQETIKPQIRTPPHLNPYNLSVLDHFAPNVHMPLVFFYRHYKKGDTDILKKSLSKCLTQYYPFAGRLLGIHNRIDCNDEGVEFLENAHSCRLDDFLFKKDQDENMFLLIPNGLGSTKDYITCPNLVKVQLNHFSDGGVAVAVTISHKIADGFTISNFCKQWATVTRGGSLINQNFYPSCTSNYPKTYPFGLDNINDVSYVTKRFVFHNSKLNDLKKKVIFMGMTPPNPSRLEVLTSLLFKCAVDAATTNMGFFRPSFMFHTVNMRSKILKDDPESAAGNIYTKVIVKVADSGEAKLNKVVNELRKVKLELEGLRDMEEVGGSFANKLSMIGGDPRQLVYRTTSVCRFPIYEVDFGWGKPVLATIVHPNVQGRSFICSDTADKDGIDVVLHLPKEEMAIFEEDKDLLAYL